MAVLHVILWILFWLFAGILALIGLVLLVLCVPLGVRLTNRPGKLYVWARIGFLSLKLTPKKELSEAGKAKKEAKKKKKAEKKAAKKERKRLKAEAKTAKNRRSGKRTGKKPPAPKQKDTFGMIRALLAALADYDDEYLKLIRINRLELTVTVGGGSPAETGRRYGKASELFGAAYPFVMRKFNVKRHRIYVCPDFVRGQTAALFDVTVTLIPIRLLKAALVFWRAFRRNRRIYCKPQPKNEQMTIQGERTRTQTPDRVRV